MIRVIERVDGKVSVLRAEPGFTLDGEQAKNPDLAGRPFVDQASPPNPDGLGRRFRDAWRVVGGVVVHDIDRVRVLRFREFEQEHDTRKAMLLNRGGWRSYAEALDTILDAAYQRLPTLTTMAALLAFEPVWPQTPPGWL